jgi:dienelactone hydrolase
MPGLPSGFLRIPLEYLHTGLRWLLDQPGVRGPRVGVTGASKGGELTLLLAATFEEVGAAVARVPSGVVWMGRDPDGNTGSTWTYRGEELPYVPFSPLAQSDRPADGSPVSIRPVYEAALADTARVSAAEIPVERSRGPILMISAGKDAQWPSTPLAEIAERRAARFGFTSIEHLRYPDAGHMIGPPGRAFPFAMAHPVTGTTMILDGGDPGASCAASADSWARTLELFRAAL